MKITTADAKRRAKAAGCPVFMWDTERALGALTDLLNAAWADGMEAAANLMDQWHSEDRHRHNYWHWAANEIRAEAAKLKAAKDGA